MMLNSENMSLEKEFLDTCLEDMKQDKQAKNTYRAFSEIQSVDTEWLWYPYIPRGKIVLLTAPPGVGKSFFALYMCAAVSDGRAFFGQDEADVRKPETAIYQTAEDGIADTLKKRLEAIQPAPRFENIINIDESEEQLTLSDTDRLEEAMNLLRPSLLVIDPLQAYLGANVDMHRANSVRPVMAKLGILAEKYNCTILPIMHQSKMHQSHAIYAALGSIDIPAVSRSMLMLAENPANREQLILCHVKSSLAPGGRSVIFHIDEGNLVFDGFSEKSADDIYGSGSSCRKTVSDRAKEYLNEMLDANNGCVSQNDVLRSSEFSQSTLYRAKERLGLNSIVLGYGKDKTSYWLKSDLDVKSFLSSLQNNEK